LQFIADLLGFSNRLNSDKLIGALTDVVKFRQNTVMEVSHRKETVVGDERRLTTADLLAPSMQLTKSALQTMTVNCSMNYIHRNDRKNVMPRFSRNSHNSNNSNNRYTGLIQFNLHQLASPIKNWTISLEPGFTAHIHMLMATSIFGLRKNC